MSTPAQLKLRSFLNHPCRVAIRDGRRFEGTLMGTDKAQNVLLGRTVEYVGDEDRYVGLIMVPGPHIVEIRGRIEPPSPTPEYY
ncbi:hypothetical protein H4R33_005300 [Dimargaris cristalligena]|uniref:Sm domain-containing protein n=1 Tax=Dimargaris cristalligena TaxID=215637 RepID=A0A4P9ZN28_9FUNG|nr:hypothetical protein H4R33_005300 [Dimargaris cristalligena]RKP34555.1 hypothetical protein BJ085DRAFT_39108 [Dimargaris cristalligena]|eukprot:RKP34555.1 hypothetical protein BJ085DRAFT_39108 [Dimargaris cristalligena]